MSVARTELAEAVEKVERHINAPARTTNKPVLVLLSGLPGTGKSFLGRRLQLELSAVLVQSDFVRKLLFPRPTYEPAESAKVYDTCHEVVARFLARRLNVVMDATNLAESKREIFYRIAERAGASLIIVRTIAPRAIILERLEHRTKGRDIADISDADVSIYEKMRISEEPIRRKHIVVDTSRDVVPAIKRILWLARGE